jgi:ribosome-associated protein YbcJ (S4-like RNA binding protein)
MALLGFTPGLPPSERAKSCSLSSKLRRPFFGLLLFILSFTAPGHAQEASREYQIKAAFLFNFAEFVKWPPDSFANPDAPFCIGILGDDPFGAALDETIQGEVINNHRMTVVRSQRIEDLEGCQMIFVSRSEEGHVVEILTELGSRPILTVSEVESFAQDGGDIDFYLSDGKVRFEINPESARRCGLKISSQLLSLGRVVKLAGGGN